MRRFAALLLVALIVALAPSVLGQGWTPTPGGGGGSSGGGTSVTWAGDLTGSTNTSQIVSAITGSGGAVGIEATIGGKSGSNPLTLTTAAVTVVAGTVVLTSAQYAAPRLKLQGTLASNATLVFPAVSGACWFIDASNFIPSPFTLTLQANSNNWATTISNNTDNYIVCYGTSKLYGLTLTP